MSIRLKVEDSFIPGLFGILMYFNVNLKSNEIQTIQQLGGKVLNLNYAKTKLLESNCKKIDKKDIKNNIYPYTALISDSEGNRIAIFNDCSNQEYNPQLY
jgi:predicted enzyme related to lactoylglutathione lyase